MKFITVLCVAIMMACTIGSKASPGPQTQKAILYEQTFPQVHGYLASNETPKLIAQTKADTIVGEIQNGAAAFGVPKDTIQGIMDGIALIQTQIKNLPAKGSTWEAWIPWILSAIGILLAVIVYILALLHKKTTAVQGAIVAKAAS